MCSVDVEDVDTHKKEMQAADDPAHPKEDSGSGDGQESA